MGVAFLRSPAARWITAGLGALLVWCAVPAQRAGAESSSLDVGGQAVVIVQVAGRGNAVTIRTWDRPAVEVDSGDQPVAVDRRVVAFGADKTPLAAPIPPMPYQQREGGQVVGMGVLPPEDFPYAGFRPGPHDVVRVVAAAGAHLTIDVPATTGILQTRVGGGVTTIDGYRGGNLLVVQNVGRVALSGVSGTAFLQMNAGVLSVGDGSFDRVRVRTNAARVVFERCHAKQIEASSISGAIVYDGGTFDPGLARFESQTGDIALGVAGPAQLAGHSQEGRVYTQFERGGTPVAQPPDGSTTATYAGGGPLVNALSTKGNVYFYDGSLQSRRTVAPEWRAVHQLFNARRRAAPAAVPTPPKRPRAQAEPHRPRTR